ncbi:preprotein translocase subunit SecG [Humitalea rosea]|uniref:Protein-export membrane protein SecG n=1 Tax=Humitalea rosea TaxID=990373 RepID=A0A2W7I1P4_9PROT|nr:preprotein translocase subunit SecG [Humitalea rosea]PZW40079.1 preprotein translocase subunit SecG [Humitalea rosea]
MTSFLLVLHLIVTLALIGVVLLQRSEGGGLGIGSSQGMGSFMGGRGTANLLTRTTGILAAIFMVLALVLALLGRGASRQGSLLDAPQGPVAPGSIIPGGADTAPAAPTTPALPALPSVPTN